eukprot:TRINITY_DN11464_c0_g1_i1.p1 TRINITY_DN11464_c0_g1~~TRINITY_DN11464_c0_g1_i1.p1  ORF type:complete len:331 (-),score=53.37 TRINITY_DN11464_c0_g1_i1:220-1212(-)
MHGAPLLLRDVRVIGQESQPWPPSSSPRAGQLPRQRSARSARAGRPDDGTVALRAAGLRPAQWRRRAAAAAAATNGRGSVAPSYRRRRHGASSLRCAAAAAAPARAIAACLALRVARSSLVRRDPLCARRCPREGACCCLRRCSARRDVGVMRASRRLRRRWPAVEEMRLRWRCHAVAETRHTVAHACYEAVVTAWPRGGGSACRLSPAPPLHVSELTVGRTYVQRRQIDSLSWACAQVVSRAANAERRRCRWRRRCAAEWVPPPSLLPALKRALVLRHAARHPRANLNTAHTNTASNGGDACAYSCGGGRSAAATPASREPRVCCCTGR